MNGNSVLVVEDDADISNMLCDLLESSGYSVKAAYSGTEALLLVERCTFDVMLLDLMLPGLSGEEVVRKVRQDRDMVVIAVSAKDDPKSKIELLRLGADDYVTKPFDTSELLARIEAQLRRYSKQTVQDRGHILTYRDLVMDTETCEVKAGGIPVPLTRREFLLLSVLVGYPKKVYTKDNLYKAAWDEEFFGDENTVNVHISNIRAKLAKANPGIDYIRTVWGIGFKMSD